MPRMSEPLPYFKGMSDAALREAYWSYRDLAFNNANIASHRAACGASTRPVARQMGRLMRAIEIIEGIARQRRISLSTAASA